MGSSKRNNVVDISATNVDIPITIPMADGESRLTIGLGRLRYGTLVIEFKDTFPSVALQNLISRGSLIGLSVVMIEADEANQKYQESLIEEEKANQLDIPEETNAADG